MLPPLQPIDPNIRRTRGGRVEKQKPGPKPKSLYELPPRAYKERVRPKVHRKKPLRAEVLHFLVFHRVYDPQAEFAHSRAVVEGHYRAPYFREAQAFFKIPLQTIANWWAKREDFGLSEHRSWSPRWPQLDETLFGDFLASRQAGKIVITSWFRSQAQSIFKVQNPACENLFTFSSGWWNGFQKLSNIVTRIITKQATHRPGDYLKIVLNFLCFIKRVSQGPKPPSPFPELLNVQPRLETYCIVNLDETPVPFKFLDGRTWDICGVKTVAGRADRSGWNKRQSTLILYIFADGLFRNIIEGQTIQQTLRLKPKLIFKGSSTGKLWDQEHDDYAPDVTVEFNPTAYNNEELFLKWINEEYLPSLPEGKDNLLVYDVAAFHKTEDIKAALRTKRVTTAMIPPGLTSLLQPLDTAINGPFKRWLRDEADIYTQKREDEGKFEWTVREKRIMTAWIVSAAMKTLEKKADLVAKSFRDCGISITPDGLEDFKIRIKDIPSDQIDFSGWENAEEVIIREEELVPASQDQDEIIVAGDDDDTELQLCLLKVKELQHLLSTAGLPRSGNKKTLLERLCRHLKEKTNDSYGKIEDSITVAAPMMLIGDSGEEDDPALDI
ncbi:hypothetical protein S40288_10165 [Stachybotrys chartarum IBT 40288]|nr:hypothetical protein S40288_10165 [Stachybotrys chartarum IBT 40288]